LFSAQILEFNYFFILPFFPNFNFYCYNFITVILG